MEEPRNFNHPLPLKKRFHPSFWDNYTMPNHSEEQQQNPTIVDTTDDAESLKQTSYDFTFIVKQVKVLKDAFQALSDDKFNPKQNAVIQVGQPGCEFIVWNFNINSGNECFGYLGLKASNLERFQCNKPFRKSFSLRGISKLFRSANRFKSESVFLYVVEGSNDLSFKWGNNALDFGHGFPVNIDLKDVDPAIESFPNCISYGFEAVLHSSILRKMSVKLHKQSMPLPETVVVSLRLATMEIMAGEFLTNSVEEEGQEHHVSTEWRHWESLESASRTATKASVYLVTDPGNRIMVRFHLDQLGDLVYLNQANLEFGPSLPFLGHFRTLS